MTEPIGWWVEVASALAAKMRGATTSMVGEMPIDASLVAALTPAVAIMSGQQPTDGEIVAIAQAAQAELGGVMLPVGSIASTLQAALFSGSLAPEGTVAAALQAADASFSGEHAQQGTIASAIARVSAALSGQHRQSGTLASAAKAAVAAFSGGQAQTGTIGASARVATAAMSGLITDGMRAFWAGSATSPSTSAVRYANFCGTIQGGWLSSEGSAASPLSDDVKITKFRVWIQTAPGAANSWTFAVRDNGADTAAIVTISDSNTSGEWSGEVNIPQLSLANISCTPTSGPTSAGRVWWIVEYETDGDFYLMPGNSGSNQIVDANLMLPIIGGHSFNPSGTRRYSIVPSNLTITKIAARVASGGTNTYRVLKNNTDLSDGVTTSGSTATIANITPFACAPGDEIELRQNDSGSSWSVHSYCITVVPGTPGEIMVPMSPGSGLNPSGSATEYAAPIGMGDNDWDPIESNVTLKMPACTVSKLYAHSIVPPGTGKTRTFTIRSNAIDTAVTCSLSGSDTVKSDTVNSASHADGDDMSIKSVPTSNPSITTATTSFVAVLQ